MLLLALLACGPSEKTYAEDFATAWCPRQLECADAATLDALGYDDEGACVALLTSGAPDYDACDFDARAAQDCLDAVAAASCEEIVAGVPAACTQVCG
jgi:hypothetical protein